MKKIIFIATLLIGVMGSNTFTFAKGPGKGGNTGCTADNCKGDCGGGKTSRCSGNTCTC